MTACGASWVSIHHGGGVGMGKSIHAGQVVRRRRLDARRRERVRRALTADPGLGVVRHADAGYPEALDVARERGSGCRCSTPSRRPGERRVASTAPRRSCARRATASPHLRPATWAGSSRRAGERYGR